MNLLNLCIIIINNYHTYNREMKTFLVIAVITCLFVMGLAQNGQECMNRTMSLASCISSIRSNNASSCGDCEDRVISYFQDCNNGTEVDLVQRRKLTKDYIKSSMIMHV